MRRGLNGPRTTSSVILYLELGVMPLRFIMMFKRVLFLHYIVNQSESSLLYRFFLSQFNAPCKGDWSLTVKDDMISLKLDNYFLDDLKLVSKNQFRKIASDRIRVMALEYLNNIKEKQSKIKNITYKTLKMQQYLQSSKINSETASRIFLSEAKCWI